MYIFLDESGDLGFDLSKTGTSKFFTITVNDKKYFFDKMPKNGWHLYGITLNKINIYEYLQRHKSKLYNFIVKQLIDTLPKYDTLNHIHFTLDNCKNKAERKDFNSYIKTHLETHFSLNTKIHITHENSQNNLCLQAVDLLCWGIQRKYEMKDKEFFKLYENKIVRHIKYLF